VGAGKGLARIRWPAAPSPPRAEGERARARTQRGGRIAAPPLPPSPPATPHPYPQLQAVFSGGDGGGGGGVSGDIQPPDDLLLYAQSGDGMFSKEAAAAPGEPPPGAPTLEALTVLQQRLMVSVQQYTLYQEGLVRHCQEVVALRHLEYRREGEGENGDGGPQPPGHFPLDEGESGPGPLGLLQVEGSGGAGLACGGSLLLRRRRGAASPT
jgi:hypothetical protein